MFTKFKKCLTAFLTAAVAVSAVGCTLGTSTKTAMSVDGYEMNAGVYIYYQNNALSEAKRLASADDSNLDVNDQDALEKVKIENKDFLNWVNDKTTANCCEHIAVIKKFDEMKLTLDEKDIANVEDYAESIFSDAEESKEYVTNGIGEESFTEILLNTYKANEIFLAIYGEGGTKNIQESTVKENYIENNARVKYVALDLHDSEGNDLEEADKTEIKNLANKFLTTVKSTSDEKEMLQKFNDISDEYQEFTANKAAEASGEEAAVTTTTAPESETTETSTTTVAPYANESIITKVTTDEDTKEEDLNYSPSKAFHDWAFNTSTKLNVPEIIEDEDKIYVAVKLDIEERMTEDDLWTESVSESQRFSMYSEDFQADIDEWVSQLRINLNHDAFDRYKPFDYEEIA